MIFSGSHLASGQDSSIKTVYIVPTSHYDFGFVDPPEAIRERAARHIDEVIRTAEADPEFRWTIESVWQVNEWLKRATSRHCRITSASPEALRPPGQYR